MDARSPKLDALDLVNAASLCAKVCPVMVNNSLIRPFLGG